MKYFLLWDQQFPYYCSFVWSMCRLRTVHPISWGAVSKVPMALVSNARSTFTKTPWINVDCTSQLLIVWYIICILLLIVSNAPISPWKGFWIPKASAFSRVSFVTKWTSKEEGAVSAWKATFSPIKARAGRRSLMGLTVRLVCSHSLTFVLDLTNTAHKLMNPSAPTVYALPAGRTTSYSMAHAFMQIPLNLFVRVANAKD